jgi:hypothetical protein
VVWCYEVRKEGKRKNMKGLRDERRNEEQDGIVKLAFNEGPTHQKGSKHSARKQKEGRNTGYGNKVGKGRWTWDNGVVYEKNKQGRQEPQG